jgi:hypothetical protein
MWEPQHHLPTSAVDTLLRPDHREPSGNSGNVRQAIEADGDKGMTVIGHRICEPLEQVLC